VAHKVLLVEDEEIWRLSTAATLKKAGYDVRTAADALAARAAFEKSPPDAVVLDINLPDGDGVELLEQFMGERPGLVGVMLTGYATLDKAMAARSLGSVDVLEKIGGDPADGGLAADLLDVLKQHLE